MTNRNGKKRMEVGPDFAGQGGATQQISDTPIADSESVEDLAEEAMRPKRMPYTVSKMREIQMWQK